MRTLIVSDLHLGAITGIDLARRPELREPLLQAAAQADRVVLLGDVLELRQGPPREAMAAARPFFEDLGAALGDGEVVVVPGNHDHALVEPCLARRALEERPQPLALEQPLELAEAAMLSQMADWAAPARLTAAYPGLWVRPDVYATHGHYLDFHLTVPTLERLSVAAMSRVLGRPADSFTCVDDYEAVASPLFAWRDAAARDARTGSLLNGVATVNVWRALGAHPDGVERAQMGESLRRALVRRALAAAFPLAVALLNRAGLGPLRADVSLVELRRAGLRAMAEVARRLGIEHVHVVFGHTHRAGPLPGDDHWEWGPEGDQGVRLVNAGCWTYAAVFLTPSAGESPYWPGTCVLVEDSGEPQLQRLLSDRGHAELRPVRA